MEVMTHRRPYNYTVYINHTGNFYWACFTKQTHCLNCPQTRLRMMCWVGRSASHTNRATSQVVVWIIPIPAADGRQNKQTKSNHSLKPTWLFHTLSFTIFTFDSTSFAILCTTSLLPCMCNANDAFCMRDLCLQGSSGEWLGVLGLLLMACCPQHHKRWDQWFSN